MAEMVFPDFATFAHLAHLDSKALKERQALWDPLDSLVRQASPVFRDQSDHRDSLVEEVTTVLEELRVTLVVRAQMQRIARVQCARKPSKRNRYYMREKRREKG